MGPPPKNSTVILLSINLLNLASHCVLSEIIAAQTQRIATSKFKSCPNCIQDLKD